MSNIYSALTRPPWASRWWLWLPPIPLIAELSLRGAGLRARADAFFGGELGFTELATVALLLPAVVFAALTALRATQPLFRAWFAVLTLGCIYFAGEEASWGQHLLQWQTPESIVEINDQSETNLHNISSWLDQKPRLLLELWIIFGGLIVAIRRKVRAIPFQPARLNCWIWPWLECTPAAALAFCVRWPERIASWRGEPPPLLFNYRLSESQEFYFAWFLLIFSWAAWRRMQQTA